MPNPKQLEELTQRLVDALPPALWHLKDDLQKNFRSVLQGALAQLDLVTREEFDAQITVLTRTREKLEALAKQMAEWEQRKQ